MEVDLSKLTYDELVELNHKVVERLKFLDSMAFKPGEQVCFQPPGQAEKFGILMKFNKKTVSVITESGRKWNVSPQALRKAKAVKNTKKSKENIIELNPFK